MDDNGLSVKATGRSGVSDILNISDELVPELSDNILKLLELGKTSKVRILDPAEGGGGKEPYAITNIEIDFDNERDLQNCVRMLRWSDDRLRARPEQLILWAWNVTFREGMKISFGVAWFDKDFFDRRKEAFKEPGHVGYYKMFGASPDRFKMEHHVIGE